MSHIDVSHVELEVALRAFLLETQNGGDRELGGTIPHRRRREANGA